MTELVGGDAEDVRQGSRSILARPEPRRAAGSHANAASLLALFGNEDDERLLATAATATRVDREPPLAPVFWRPAGKAPALGEYSFLEVPLGVAFGSDRG